MNNRISIFGTQVTITNKQKAPKQLRSLLGKSSGYINFPNAYVASQATKDDRLQEILNNSLLTFPDGEPLAIYARQKGYKDMTSVSGFWLLKELLADKSISHYFYGSDEENLALIKENLDKEFPGANILGYKPAPFVALDEIDNNATMLSDIQDINALKPSLVWIGLNSPKQDYLMSHYNQYLDNSIMLGVGGVFDYLSGALAISPEWVKKLSMRWLYRIIQNPKRYFNKTISSIFAFGKCYFAELLFGRKY